MDLRAFSNLRLQKISIWRKFLLDHFLIRTTLTTSLTDIFLTKISFDNLSSVLRRFLSAFVIEFTYKAKTKSIISIILIFGGHSNFIIQVDEVIQIYSRSGVSRKKTVFNVIQAKNWIQLCLVKSFLACSKISRIGPYPYNLKALLFTSSFLDFENKRALINFLNMFNSIELSNHI